LAIPVMLAASGLDLLKAFGEWLMMPKSWSGCSYGSWGVPASGVVTCGAYWEKKAFIFSGQEWLILGVGMTVTFIVSLLVLKKLMALMKEEKAWVYLGIYRVVIGVFWLFMI
ncbi:hypothetical protein FWH30_01880, partial [Microgenomates group bacterium]|nr:hypothetical protein [Microgenomates group bacterium]